MSEELLIISNQNMFTRDQQEILISNCKKLNLLTENDLNIFLSDNNKIHLNIKNTKEINKNNIEQLLAFMISINIC